MKLRFCAEFLVIFLQIKIHSTLDETAALEDEIANAFLVEINEECTGTLIANNWVLSAAHCISTRVKPPIEGGDIILNASESSYGSPLTYKRRGSNISAEDLWTEPISVTPYNKSPRLTLWRFIEQVIINGQFEDEAHSWKGKDLVLLKLKPLEADGNTKISGTIAPACLPATTFKDLEQEEENFFMSGFGFRKVPHCITNNNGPEKFDVCGRPKSCSRDHRTKECGIYFLYNGIYHRNCLKRPNPSQLHPECVRFRNEMGSYNSTAKVVYIVENKKIVATCYKSDPNNSKGWCTTRSPGVFEDTEPTFTKGWGFCSEDKDQEFCNERRPSIFDETPVKISVLTEEFCTDKLEDNLHIEQIETRRSDYENMTSRFGMFCTGRNITNDIEQDSDVFTKSGEKGVYKKVKHPLPPYIKSQMDVKPYSINGGPSCFGDSGGPVFRLVHKEESNKIIPVLIGVFSFMLWGTCTGEAEPGYNVRVKHEIDWILKHVPKDEICWLE